MSVDTLRRMRSYFARHEVDKQGAGWGVDSKGYQAWLLWGGDPGRAWVAQVLGDRARNPGASMRDATRIVADLIYTTRDTHPRLSSKIERNYVQVLRLAWQALGAGPGNWFPMVTGTTDNPEHQRMLAAWLDRYARNMADAEMLLDALDDLPWHTTDSPAKLDAVARMRGMEPIKSAKPVGGTIDDAYEYVAPRQPPIPLRNVTSRLLAEVAEYPSPPTPLKAAVTAAQTTPPYKQSESEYRVANAVPVRGVYLGNWNRALLWALPETLGLTTSRDLAGLVRAFQRGKLQVFEGPEAELAAWFEPKSSKRAPGATTAYVVLPQRLREDSMDVFSYPPERFRHFMLRKARLGNPTVRGSTRQITTDMYPGLFGDIDTDGFANADDPSPFVPGSDPVEEVRLADEVRHLIELRNAADNGRVALMADIQELAPTATHESRTKTPYSMINKLRRKRIFGAHGITDLVGGRIITRDIHDLRAVQRALDAGALGRVLEVEDFFKRPNNGYRALHYIIERPIELDGKQVKLPMELQLKTERLAALSHASHTVYKSGRLDGAELDRIGELVMRADAGDARAAAEVDPLLHDTEALEHRLTSARLTNPMDRDLESLLDEDGWE